MTQTYHTPHSVGADLTASEINQRLSDLDSGIVGVAADVTALDIGTTKGDLYVFNGTSLVRLAAGANGLYLQADSSQALGLKYAAADMPTGYINGFMPAVGATTITIAPGVCRSEDDTVTIRRTTAAGNITINPAVVGANGIDVGALGANAWYRIFVIYNPDTATAAGLLSTSASPVMPSGYTVRRRVGWAKTNGSSALYKSYTTGSGEIKRTRWLEDTTASPFLIWNSINVGSGWTSQSMSTVVPSTSRAAIAYHERASTGAIIQMRVDSAQVLQLSLSGTTALVLDLPLSASQAFEYIGGSNDEDATLHAQGYVDDLAVSIV